MKNSSAASLAPPDKTGRRSAKTPSPRYIRLTPSRPRTSEKNVRFYFYRWGDRFFHHPTWTTPSTLHSPAALPARLSIPAIRIAFPPRQRRPQLRFPASKLNPPRHPPHPIIPVPTPGVAPRPASLNRSNRFRPLSLQYTSQRPSRPGATKRNTSSPRNSQLASSN
jgi:hypothetical protein